MYMLICFVFYFFSLLIKVLPVFYIHKTSRDEYLQVSYVHVQIHNKGEGTANLCQWGCAQVLSTGIENNSRQIVRWKRSAKNHGNSSVYQYHVSVITILKTFKVQANIALKLIHQRHWIYDTRYAFLPFLYSVSKKLRKASAFYRSYLMMTLSLSGGSPTDNCFCRTNRSVAAYIKKNTRYFKYPVHVVYR